jgi:hypothetical protein
MYIYIKKKMDQKHKFVTTLMLFILFGIILYIIKRYTKFQECFSECDRTNLTYEEGARCINSEYRLSKAFCCTSYGQRKGHIWKGDNKSLINNQLKMKERVDKKLKELENKKTKLENEKVESEYVESEN